MTCFSHVFQIAFALEATNKKILRIGDKVHDGSLAKRNKVWAHPNAWTTEGTLRYAFEQIGVSGTSASRYHGLRYGSSSRMGEAVGVVSLAASWHINQGMKTIMHVPPSRHWQILEDHVDLTPLKVRFGSMRVELAPIARSQHMSHVAGIYYI